MSDGKSHASRLFAKADGALHVGLHTMIVADDNFKYIYILLRVLPRSTIAGQVNSLNSRKSQKTIGFLVNRLANVNVMYPWSNATGVSRVVVLQVT